MNSARRSLFALFIPFLFFVAWSIAGAEDVPAIDFQKQVLPILDAKCIRCHSAKSKKGKLDVSSREAILIGGNSGPAIRPGNADKSLLVELIHFNEMPPKNSQPRVTKEELKLLKSWINAGAQGPK